MGEGFLSRENNDEIAREVIFKFLYHFFMVPCCESVHYREHNSGVLIFRLYSCR